MILDNTVLLSDQQAITATAVSTNSIDLGARGVPMFATAAPPFDIGKGELVPFLVQVTQQFTAGGAGTLTISLETDDDVAFGSPVTVFTTAALALATLKPGYQIPIQYLPKGMAERYFQLRYTVATGPMTAGKITAGIDMGNQDVY